MDENTNKEAHLIGKDLIDSISAGIDNDCEYLVRLPSGVSGWAFCDNQSCPPPQYPLSTLDNRCSESVEYVFAPPPPPYHIKYPSYTPRPDSSVDSYSNLSYEASQHVDGEPKHNPYGPIKSPAASSAGSFNFKQRLGSNSSTGSISPVLSSVHGKSYRDAVGKSQPPQLCSIGDVDASAVLSGNRKATEAAKNTITAAHLTRNSSASSSPVSQIGRSSPCVACGLKLSSKYGLDTFVDATDEVSTPENQKMDLVGFISKDSLTDRDSNANKKNATTDTQQTFRKITRKKSRAETRQEISPPNSKLDSQKQQNASKKNKQANKSSAAAFAAEVNPPVFMDSDTKSRFAVLTSGAPADSRNKPRHSVADVFSHDTSSNCEDGPLLNNDERLSSLAFRSKSATRESAYINNDLRAAAIAEQSPVSFGRKIDNGSGVGNTNTEVRSRNAYAVPGSNVATTKTAGSGKMKNREHDVTVSRRRKKPSEFISWIECICTAVSQWVKMVAFWFVALIVDVGCQLLDIGLHFASSAYTRISTFILRMWYGAIELCKNFVDRVKKKNFRRWRWNDSQQRCQLGFETNISLPNTGDEAMARLLSCKGQDAYSILGLRCDCTDDDIKRYYRRQAFLVHPDKNSAYGADEAFKILGHAFELVGTPDKRQKYNIENLHRSRVVREFEDMLSRLREKMEEALNTMHCDCGNKHRRFKVERSTAEARYCRKCRERHHAREGDIWAESKWCGLLWYYYACMDGAVYDITQWASCPKNNLKHMKPNTHVVQYRLITGRNRQQAGSSSSHLPSPGQHRTPSDADIDDFLSRLYNDKFPSSFTSSTAGPADFVQSKFNPPPCGHGDRLKKAGRRRKTRN